MEDERDPAVVVVNARAGWLCQGIAAEARVEILCTDRAGFYGVFELRKSLGG